MSEYTQYLSVITPIALIVLGWAGILIGLQIRDSLKKRIRNE